MEVSRQAKCVGKEIPKYALVAGSYRVVGAEDGDAEPPFKVHLQLTSPEGKQLHYGQRQTEGHFGFRADEAGDFTLCVWLSRGTERDVPAAGSARAGRSKARERRKLDVAWRVGKSHEAHLSEAPKKEQIETFDSELKTLENMVASVEAELAFFHERDAGYGQCDAFQSDVYQPGFAPRLHLPSSSTVLALQNLLPTQETSMKLLDHVSLAII
ncbi:hypothetical protein CLOM_g13499 [Closterium sp. NIES-68]|nr:hypothetical protein CLOM_g13499 [Closterium sp. NIES-68]GJP86715.1 hypothetical protein CLOP_g16709 [Closterium sp. NIES-67]